MGGDVLEKESQCIVLLISTLGVCLDFEKLKGKKRIRKVIFFLLFVLRKVKRKKNRKEKYKENLCCCKENFFLSNIRGK